MLNLICLKLYFIYIKILYNFMLGIFKYGIIYRTYDFIKSYISYRKTLRNIKEVFYGDDFKNVIHTYLNVELDKDWLGRLYGVINPNIDINGNFNVNNVVIEIDGNNTNTNEYVKNWIYKQLNLMGQLFKMKSLYSNINLEIEHIEPVEYDNYLIIFDIADRPVMTNSFKNLCKTVAAYAIIAGTTLGILFAMNII